MKMNRAGSTLSTQQLAVWGRSRGLQSPSETLRLAKPGPGWAPRSVMRDLGPKPVAAPMETGAPLRLAPQTAYTRLARPPRLRLPLLASSAVGPGLHQPERKIRAAASWHGAFLLCIVICEHCSAQPPLRGDPWADTPAAAQAQRQGAVPATIPGPARRGPSLRKLRALPDAALARQRQRAQRKIGDDNGPEAAEPAGASAPGQPRPHGGAGHEQVAPSWPAPPVGGAFSREPLKTPDEMAAWKFPAHDKWYAGKNKVG